MRSAISRWMFRLLLAAVTVSLAPNLHPLANGQSPELPPRSPRNLPVSPDADRQAPASSDQPAPNNSNAPQSPDSGQQPSTEAAANDTMFVFRKQVQEVFLHASVVDDQFRHAPAGWLLRLPRDFQQGSGQFRSEGHRKAVERK